MTKLLNGKFLYRDIIVPSDETMKNYSFVVVPSKKLNSLLLR